MKTKRIGLSLAAAAIALASSAQEAKYIFYFIGDGMGPNHIALTEYYRGEMADSLGLSPLGFTQWPVASLASNYSASTRVTDSAASGTALATGHKTTNGFIGMAPDASTPLKSIAYRAKEAGKRVGIASSVGINHAHPPHSSATTQSAAPTMIWPSNCQRAVLIFLPVLTSAATRSATP